MTDAGLCNVALADRVLRLWWKGQPDMPAPRLGTLLKNMAKHPINSKSHWIVIRNWCVAVKIGAVGVGWKS